MTDQSLTEQVGTMGAEATYYLSDAARALLSMAAEANALAARLTDAASDVTERRQALVEHLASDTPGLHFPLGNIATHVTDVAFNAVNTVTLASRAKQAVTAVDRAVEAVNTARVLSQGL
jgi:hypothetical protein